MYELLSQAQRVNNICHFLSDFQKHLDEIKAKVFNKENSKSFIEKTAPLFSKTNLETAKN